MEPQYDKSRSVDEQIEWILSSPDMSPWIKTALESARQRTPIDVLNDLELLNLILVQWCEESMNAR